MKRPYLILFQLFLCFNTLIAQKGKEGVFLKADDFITGSISYSPVLNNKYRLIPNELSSRLPVKIKSGNTRVRLKKDSIYGYRDRKGNCYRFYQDDDYKILNPAEKILIYSTSKVEGGPKSYSRTTRYFFSQNSAAPIYPLTRSDLNEVFSDDASFLVLLDIYFPGNEDLISYDEIQKEYLLNRVFKMSSDAFGKLSHK